MRESAHSVVEVYARVPDGACGVVRAGLVGLLVERLVAESGQRLQELILDTLHWCFQVDTQQGLQSGALAICCGLLQQDEGAALRGRAARIIFDLTVPLEGKVTACSIDGCVRSLVALLDDGDHFVCSQAVAALMRYCACLC